MFCKFIFDLLAGGVSFWDVISVVKEAMFSLVRNDEQSTGNDKSN